MAYGKIFQKMFEGSLLDHGGDVWPVFVAMIVMSDKEGVLDMTPGALARHIAWDKERVEAAIAILEQPDPESRNTSFEGRRLIRLDDHRSWGWIVTTKAEYRDLIEVEEQREKWRIKDKKKRERKKALQNSPLKGEGSPQEGEISPHTDTDTNTDTGKEEAKALSVSSETDGEQQELQELGPVEDDELQEAVEVWNECAKAYGVPGVKKWRDLRDKHRRLSKHMRRDFPNWTLAEAIRVADKNLPGIWHQSWFRFKNFFFEHDYLKKNEKLYTGFYESLYSNKQEAAKGVKDSGRFKKYD